MRKIAMLIMVAILLMLFSGCKTTEIVKTDTIYQRVEKIDSTYWFEKYREAVREFSYRENDTIRKDSIYIIKTDSTIEKTIYNYEKVILKEIDSVYNEKDFLSLKDKYEAEIDSLREVKNEVKYVEVEKVGKFKSFLMYIGVVCLIGLVLFFGFKIKDKFFM